MVDPGFVPGLIGAGIGEHRLILVTETAARCTDNCKSLHNLLKDLGPVVSDVVAQTGEPHDSTSTAFVSSTLTAWLEGLLKTLQDADGVVQECVDRRLLAPWPKYRTATNILKIMECIRDLLQQAPIFGIGVRQWALQAKRRVETNIDGLQINLKQMAVAFPINYAILREDGEDIQRTFRNVRIQVDKLRTSDDTNFTFRLTISRSSAGNLLFSPSKEEQIVPRFLFGLDPHIRVLDPNIRAVHHCYSIRIKSGDVKRRLENNKGALLDLDQADKAHEFNVSDASIAQAKAQQFLRDYQGPWERIETDCPSVSSNDASKLAWSINLDNNGKESKITVGLTMGVVATRQCQMIGIEEHNATFKSLLRTTLSALENLESIMGRLQQNQERVKVFHMQCNYLIDTLTTNVGNRLRQYCSLLKLAEDPEVMKSVVTHKSAWLRVLSLCIRSLGELVCALELGAVLVTDCCKMEWWSTAVRLFVVTPHLKLSRWSLFLVVLRQCEWHADIVELAFGRLKELYACEHVFFLDTAVFKWSEEKHRFILEKHGNLTKIESSNVGADHDNVILEVTMEDLDNKFLLQRVNKLLDENIVIMRFRPRPRKRKMASFLKQKLEGPSPRFYCQYIHLKLANVNVLKVGTRQLCCQFIRFKSGNVKRRLENNKGALLDLDQADKAHEFNVNDASIAQAKAQQFLRDYQGPWERIETDCPSVSSNGASKLAWSINLDNTGKESKITVGLTMDVVATRHCQMIGVEEHDATFKSLLQTTLSALENLESIMGRLQQNQERVKVFHMQSNYLIDTLTTNVGNRLRQYCSLLKLAEDPEVMKSVVTHKSAWLRVLSLCIRSLGELVCALELGAVLVTDCCKMEWWSTAVRLFVVTPHLKLSRWSLFLDVLRQCEWSADIVELAFGLLKELYACEHVFFFGHCCIQVVRRKTQIHIGKTW